MSSLLFKIIAVKYGFWIIVACRRSKHIFKGGWGCLLKASKVYEHLSYNNTSNLPTAKDIGFLLKWLVHSLLYIPRNMHSVSSRLLRRRTNQGENKVIHSTNEIPEYSCLYHVIELTAQMRHQSDF